MTELLWNDLQDVLKIWPEVMAAPSGLHGDLPPVRRCLQPPGTILYVMCVCVCVCVCARARARARVLHIYSPAQVLI